MSKFSKGSKVQVISKLFPHWNYTGTVSKVIPYSSTRFKYSIKWDSDEGLMSIGGLVSEDGIIGCR